jgi:hypothetical protein
MARNSFKPGAVGFSCFSHLSVIKVKSLGKYAPFLILMGVRDAPGLGALVSRGEKTEGEEPTGKRKEKGS